MSDADVDAFVERRPDGVRIVDTGFHRPRFDAAYLIVDHGRAAFVDTGTNHAVPRLLAALAAEGLGRDAVEYVIPTHVHLDHAGGAGALMRELPQARLVVHPRGARHMIDPQHLVRGATAVYGAEEVERSYGAPVPIDAERVVATSDGMTIELGGPGGRPLLFIDTPGHAMHHHCIVDRTSGGVFTGDTFGLSYREFDTERGPWVMPTTTPVQFQPDALRRSIERIVACAPTQVFLTHYGGVGDVGRLARILVEQLDAIVALGRSLAPGPDRHEALKRGLERIHVASLRAHGVALPDEEIRALLELDLELNAQGVAIWLDRTAP